MPDRVGENENAVSPAMPPSVYDWPLARLSAQCAPSPLLLVQQQSQPCCELLGLLMLCVCYVYRIERCRSDCIQKEEKVRILT